MKTKIRALVTSFTFWSLAALGAGLGSGIYRYWTGSQAVSSLASFVQPVGTVWLRALQLVVVPLVVLQLLTVLTAQGEDRGLGKVGVRVLVAVAEGSLVILLVSLALAWP